MNLQEVSKSLGSGRAKMNDSQISDCLSLMRALIKLSFDLWEVETYGSIISRGVDKPMITKV